MYSREPDAGQQVLKHWFTRDEALDMTATKGDKQMLTPTPFDRVMVKLASVDWLV